MAQLKSLTEEIQSLSPQTQYIIWAALIAMVMDIHSPQDMMTERQWDHAEAMLGTLMSEGYGI